MKGGTDSTTKVEKLVKLCNSIPVELLWAESSIPSTSFLNELESVFTEIDKLCGTNLTSRLQEKFITVTIQDLEGNSKSLSFPPGTTVKKLKQTYAETKGIVADTMGLTRTDSEASEVDSNPLEPNETYFLVIDDQKTPQELPLEELEPLGLNSNPIGVPHPHRPGSVKQTKSLFETVNGKRNTKTPLEYINSQEHYGKFLVARILSLNARLVQVGYVPTQHTQDTYRVWQWSMGQLFLDREYKEWDIVFNTLENVSLQEYDPGLRISAWNSLKTFIKEHILKHYFPRYKEQMLRIINSTYDSGDSKQEYISFLNKLQTKLCPS